ncbi:heavy metal translocating P-type ATPase [Metabacillus herbersteinensis]|uniref:Heavy metal translocating P-type ATPase n=1 Tax=Metabacillus herbersteinensis TaxID=283816 RepID=A0ABV6GAA7_9BACI
MGANVKVINENEIHSQQRSAFFEKLKEHAELIGALLSGVLILIGWVIQRDGSDMLSVALFITAFLIGGYAKAKEGIEETISEKKLNVELLMIFAAIGSAMIGYWVEGAILIFIFALSGALETFTMNKSQRELSALMSIQPEEALLLENGKERMISVSELQVGDVILVKPGERIPTDSVLLTGHTSIDQSAITGESMPVEKKVDDHVFAGTVNGNGSITLNVTKLSTETLFQKILDLVQSAQSEKSPSQQFIEKFEGTYVKGVLVTVAVMMVLPHFALGWSWSETIYRAMVLMVVASPCALVASIMPATLSAISNGARNGLLFKGGVHLERLSKTKVVAFDKTGTLTKGEPVVTDVLIADRVNESEFFGNILSIEKQSNHPLAKAIVQDIEKKHPDLTAKMISVNEKSGFGVIARLNGEEWTLGKADLIGRDLTESFQENIGNTLAQQGKTIVYVKDEQGIVGLLALKDVVREDTIKAIQELKAAGIRTVMLTGDSETTATAIAIESGIDDYVAECLPEDKVKQIQALEKKYGSVTMIGDGINDAPALATANVGIAMGEGTDVALETADIVLMKNELTKLTKAVELSRKMNKIVKQNIIFSMIVICLLICSNFLQIVDLPLGVIGHEGSTILVILNGLRLLKA